ncbi:hypothetical protein ACH5RR_018926 [Cinchona calisaya]|uniref:C2H2-type domain-containing protein n=1 Tax=Cinchona calisaya TaxID=153742 RepID=A0ABD2ZQN5_9GENT
MVGAVVDEADPHQDLPHIVKGKRTKRLRPQSPIPFTITTQDSSSGEGGYASNGDNNCCINNVNNNNNNNNNNNQSSSSSSEDQSPPDHYATTTEEDEYTAKCLILLAQGGHHVIKEPPRNKFDYDLDFGTEKFNSKRYIEAPVSGNGRAGMYVYECKTCGRTFPSFQALGGHRASHRKPKNMAAAAAAAAAAEEKKLSFYMSDDEEETIFKNSKYKTNSSSVLSLDQFLNNREMSSNNMKLHKSASFRKTHECAHCGAEFASGQALGGHMRRHRGAPAITSTTMSLGQLSPEITDHDSDEPEAKRARKGGLSLDLNLPAPEDDHLHKDSNKFGLASKPQQQINQQQKQEEEEEEKMALVLSTTQKLVHCHH